MVIFRTPLYLESPVLLSDLLTTGWRKTWLLILSTHCSGAAPLRTKWHLQFCLLAVPHVYVVCAINTLEINFVQTQWQYFLLPPLFDETSLICIIILSFPHSPPSLSSLNGRKHFGCSFSKASVRADAGICLSRPMKLCLCFPYQALVFTFFCKGIASADWTK